MGLTHHIRMENLREVEALEALQLCSLIYFQKQNCTMNQSHFVLLECSRHQAQDLESIYHKGGVRSLTWTSEGISRPH